MLLSLGSRQMITCMLLYGPLNIVEVSRISHFELVTPFAGPGLDLPATRMLLPVIVEGDCSFAEELFEQRLKHTRNVAAAFVADAQLGAYAAAVYNADASMFDDCGFKKSLVIHLENHNVPRLEKVLYVDKVLADFKAIAVIDEDGFLTWQVERQYELEFGWRSMGDL